MKKIGLSIMTISVLACSVHAQSITPQVINVSGGSYLKDNVQLDWSVGELPLIDMMKDAGSLTYLTNGYIQPVGTKANTDRNFGDDEIIILPNPTRDVLQVNFLARIRGRVGMKLFDVLGREVYTHAFTSYATGNIVRIDMTRLQSGTYMLYIYATSIDPSLVQRTGSYKILKLN